MNEKPLDFEPSLAQPQSLPLLLVLTGPSGVGKDTIIARMHERHLPFHYAVTATTRPQRDNEIHGVHYFFVTNPQFSALLDQGELLENAIVYGNRYGIPKAEIREALLRGEDVILKPDVQGARHLMQLVPEAVFIFIAPTDQTELRHRLEQRHTETSESLERRLNNYGWEMQAATHFDYIVFNREGQLDETVDTILAIIRAEKCRVKPRQIKL